MRTNIHTKRWKRSKSFFVLFFPVVIQLFALSQPPLFNSMSSLTTPQDPERITQTKNVDRHTIFEERYIRKAY